MPTGNPTAPPDEVVAALAQSALLALLLAAIVVITRALQVSFDRRQAERAREEAVRACQTRLRTLSERNTFYQSGATREPPPGTVTTTTTAAAAAGGLGAAVRLPSNHLNDDCGSHSSGLNSTDSDPRDSTCPTPPSCAVATSTASGGPVSILQAASSLLQRRPSPSSSSPFSTSASFGGERPAAGGVGSGGSGFAFDRSLSMGASGGGGGGGATSGLGSGSGSLGAGQAPWSGSAGDRHSGPLLSKASDSLLETSRVLGSVPQETIISTRQVLAAFNYDYSALHRREATYVHGSSPWCTRSGRRFGPEAM